RAIEALLGAGGVESDRIDAEFAQEPSCNHAVRSRAVNFQGPPVYQLYPAVQLELVALRVPTKVVVIVEDENACRALALAIEMGAWEPPDAAPDNYEVICLGRPRHQGRETPVA